MTGRFFFCKLAVDIRAREKCKWKEKNAEYRIYIVSRSILTGNKRKKGYEKMTFPKMIALSLVIIALIIAGCGAQKVTTVEKYPVKPITMIVPYAAGGTADMMARGMEKVAAKYFGQTLVINNIPGGGATIGWNELAGAKPDGYTIGIVSSGVFLQPLYDQTRYHYPTALEPLVQIAHVPIIIVSRSDQPWETGTDLVNYARQHPGEIKYGHPGLGAVIHVGAEMFAKEAGIDIVQVPFRGDAESLAALLGGHIKLMFTTPYAVKEHVKSGKVKVLAVTADKRLADPVFADVPTCKEQGLNVSIGFIQAVGAPKGLPAEVKDRLAEGLKGIVNDTEFKKSMDGLGMPVEYQGFKEFGEKWITEGARLTQSVKETGIAERIASQKK